MYKVQIQIRRPQKPRNPAPFQHFSRRTSQNARPFQRFQSEPQKPSAISTFPSQIFHTPQVRSSRFSALRVLQSKRLKRTIMNVQPNNPNPPSPETSVLSVSSVISVLIFDASTYLPRSRRRLPARKKGKRPAISTFQPHEAQNPRPFQCFQSEPQKPSAISTFPNQNFPSTQVRSSRFSALRVLEPQRLKRTIMNVQPNNPNPPSPETSVLSVSSVISVLFRKSCEHPARPQWRVPNAFQSQRDHLKTFDL